MAGVITGISAQKFHLNRLRIEIDGEFNFGVDRLVGAWLFTGQYLSDPEIASLTAADAEEVLYQSALRLISYRPRTKRELALRLQQKGYSSDPIAAVLERLQENRLLDDESYAEQWVCDRNQFHPRSKRLVLRELKQKGISADVASQAANGMDDEEVLALAAGRKVLSRWSALDHPTFDKRCTDYLARRGFSYSIIRKVLPDLWQESREMENYIE